MRLPYLQVTTELLEQVSFDIAVEVRVSRSRILAGLLDMLKWGLGRCPDHLPPSYSDVVEGEHAVRLMARAAGIPEKKAEAFVEACIHSRPALLERVEGGIRFRGFDRYDAAWRKAHEAAWKALQEEEARRAVSGFGAEPAPNRGGTGAEPEQNRGGTGPQDADAEVGGGGEESDNPSTAPPPTTTNPLPSSEGPDEALAWLEDVGIEGVDVMGVPITRYEKCVACRPTPEGLWAGVQLQRAELGYAVEAVQPTGWDVKATRVLKESTPEAFLAEHWAFLEDDSIRADGHPTGVFLSCWEKARKKLRAV